MTEATFPIIQVYKIKETGISKASEQASYRNISASYGDNVLMSVDLLNQNNVYGFRLSNLVQQFVSVENATVSYFVSSLGLDGSMFTETLQGVDITGLLDLSDDEVSELEKTYITLMLTDIDKSHYTTKKNSVITLSNKESVTTNAYTLTVTKNELDKLYKKILNQAINDELILGKLENVDNKIKEAGFAEPEGKSLKEKYTSKVQEKIDGLEYQGEDARQIAITVYEQKGTTVRTVFKSEDEEYVLDLDNSTGKVLTLKTTKLEDQNEITKTYTLGKTEDSQNRDRIFAYTDPNQSLEGKFGIIQNSDGISLAIDANYKSTEINNIDFTSKTNIALSASEAIPVNFDEKNNIVLNNYEGEKVLAILESLKDRTISSLENTQGIINSKLLNNIILIIDDREQRKQQEEQDNLELKKEKFNNKFALYEGEEVELQYVEKLLETAGKNMTDYQVISGTQIRLLIKEGVENEKKAKEILTAI